MSVCLFVCEQHFSRSYGSIFLKIRYIGCLWPKGEMINFWWWFVHALWPQMTFKHQIKFSSNIYPSTRARDIIFLGTHRKLNIGFHLVQWPLTLVQGPRSTRLFIQISRKPQEPLFLHTLYKIVDLPSSTLTFVNELHQ